MDLVQIASWSGLRWLRHGFSTRSGGVSTVYGGRSLNLGWTADDDPLLIAENRRRFVSAVMREETERRMATLCQTHSAEIRVMRERNDLLQTAEGRVLFEGDGLMTDQPGALLAIQTADCVPVIVVDPAKRAVAVFHAGWRGTVAQIVEDGVAKMADEYGSRAEDLLAAIGPSIGACCYGVGEEVRTAFWEQFTYADQLFRDGQLDLWEANRLQLVAAGVLAGRVTVVGECTGCARDARGDRRYFSHRIDHGVAGRMMSVVGLASLA